MGKIQNPAHHAVAAGSETFLAGSWNSSENSPFTARKQAVSNLERLALMRGSAWRVGDNAAVHLDLALGSLGVADDIAFIHHVGKVVAHVRALAKLANKVSALRGDSL